MGFRTHGASLESCYFPIKLMGMDFKASLRQIIFDDSDASAIYNHTNTLLHFYKRFNIRSFTSSVIIMKLLHSPQMQCSQKPLAVRPLGEKASVSAPADRSEASRF